MYDKKIANNLRKMDENESATFFVNDNVLLYWSIYNSSNVFSDDSNSIVLNHSTISLRRSKQIKDENTCFN